MLQDYLEAENRSREYARRKNATIGDRLGWGQDGVVVPTSLKSALKAFRYEELYRQELAVYQRLADWEVTSVRGFAVPRLLGYDDDLWVLEMQIVERPFVLDFAGGYLDRPPEFDPEVMAEIEEMRREQFGERWPTVQGILAEFRSYGIYLTDIKPGNIEFADDPTE
jgi:hypothetical protein